MTTKYSFTTFPLSLVFLTSIVFYGVTLPIITVHWQSEVATWVVCVLWWLYAAIFYYLTWRFSQLFFIDKMTVAESLSGFVNILFGAVHVTASLGMSIWLLNQGAFVGIADTSNRFNIFYSYFLSTACDFILQTGLRTVVPTPASAAGATFGVIGGVNGVIFIMFVFNLAQRPFRASQRLRRV